MSEKKEYPPELRVDYDETEDDGFAKVAEVARKKKVADQWVPDPSKPKKKVAKVYNNTHIVFMYPDAYRRDGEYPVYNGSPFCVWKAMVGTYDEHTGDFTPTAGEVSFIDNSKDRWITDRITRLMGENVGGDDPRKHVWIIGKRPGRGPMPGWFVDYVARADDVPLPDGFAQASTATVTREPAFELTSTESDVVTRLNQSLADRDQTLSQYAESKGQSVKDMLVDLFTSGLATDADGKPIKLSAERAGQIAENASAAGFTV